MAPDTTVALTGAMDADVSARAAVARPLFLRAALVLVGAFVVMLLPGLNATPLERAEIYFVDGARSLVERGDWLVPYYRGEPFFDKPALTYWLMAASFWLLGFTPAAARLVPVLAGAGVVATTMVLGRRLFGDRAALLAGAILGTTFAFAVFGRVAMSDMLLTLWTLLAFTVGGRALREPETAHWSWPVLGALFGLGFQTKGPIAILLPGLGLAMLAWQDRKLVLPARRELLRGTALFALFGLGWFFFVWLRLGWEPLAWFFLRENLQRFAGETYDTGQPPWFYVTSYLAGGLPWSVLFPAAAVAAWRADAEEGRRARALLGWLGLMVLLLSLARGKIDYYLLPLYPAISLLLGRWLGRVEFGEIGSGVARVGLLLNAGVAAIVPWFALRLPAEWLPANGHVLTIGLLYAVALVVALAALRPRPIVVAGTLAGSSALLHVVAFAVYVPAFRDAQPGAAIVTQVLGERGRHGDVSFVVCGDPARVERDVLFFARVPARTSCELLAYAGARSRWLLLLEPHETHSVLGAPNVRTIGTFRYIPADAASLHGLIDGTEPSVLTLAANFDKPVPRPTPEPTPIPPDPEVERLKKRERRHKLNEELDAYERALWEAEKAAAREAGQKEPQ